MTSRPVTALVLAGGEGRRMGGADKARLVVGGATLLDRVLSAARPLAVRVVVAGPPRPTVVPGVEFRPDSFAGGGPVPPILAMAQAVEEGDAILLVVAVDMALVTTADLGRLVAAAGSGSTKVAAAVDARGRPNPLLAAYRVGHLRSCAESKTFGAGSAATLLLAAAGADVTAVVLGPEATQNVNTPADLEAAELAVDGG